MPKKFDDQANNAPQGERAAIRALQAWQHLIAKAGNRQIVRYKELRDLMHYPNDKPLTQILGDIMYYCQQNDLPPLTIIVVNKSGVPGSGFSAERIEDYHQRREDVFNYPWYEDFPPSVNDLIQARKQGHS